MPGPDIANQHSLFSTRNTLAINPVIPGASSVFRSVSTAQNGTAAT
ncbi:hypothetical protein UZS93_13940 [Escherichia coli]|nr:hypothetical protein [Escherichia coli]MDY8958398.1 hypothetical protein [Escherichia coli]MDY8997112.1 hypothetical protein [Escherichia coli]MDY9034239.1 hypothetical protein [Escherichia coli]